MPYSSFCFALRLSVRLLQIMWSVKLQRESAITTVINGLAFIHILLDSEIAKNENGSEKSSSVFLFDK